MTNAEMYEKSKQRPANYPTLSPQEQWEIDKELGILDWDGSKTDVDTEALRRQYLRCLSEPQNLCPSCRHPMRDCHGPLYCPNCGYPGE